MTRRSFPRWHVLPLLGFVWMSLGALSRGHAEPAASIVVVSHAVHELTASERRVADLVEEALRSRSLRFVSMHEARDRALAHSRFAAISSASDLQVVEREAQAALEHAAFGRSVAAQHSVDEVVSRAEQALESMNRDTKTARHVLDACLARLRDAITRGERCEALEEAMRCRRLVPDLSPSASLHPASVIGVLAEADDQLRRLRMGRLRVLSEPEVGCAVYVNGRHLGVTPFRLERAAAGEYRVQVECGRAPGRVHVIQLGSERSTLRVDSGFDRALRSGDRLALVHEQADVSEVLLAKHAQQVARLVDAEEVVLVGVDASSAVLRRVDASEGRLLGRARFAWARAESMENGELARALESLFEGRIEASEVEASTTAETARASRSIASEDKRPPHVTFEPASAVQARRDNDRAPRGRGLRIAAASLAASGTALLATGVVYEIERARSDARLARLELGPAHDKEHARYEDAATLRWLGVGGGFLLTAAVPLWRMGGVAPRTMSWWSYAAGVAGVGVAVWGGIELARHGRCALYLDEGCYALVETKARAALLWSAAAPLLTIPLDRWIAVRRATRARAVEVRISSMRKALMLTLRRAW